MRSAIHLRHALTHKSVHMQHSVTSSDLVRAPEKSAMGSSSLLAVGRLLLRSCPRAGVLSERAEPCTPPHPHLAQLIHAFSEKHAHEHHQCR